jgi:hypothetical protein
MKKLWVNPVKHPAQQATMQTPGNFQDFKELMRKAVPKREERPMPVSSSRAPDAS